MLTLLINAALGGITALTLVTLLSTLRAFLPAWRRLSAELAAFDSQPVVMQSAVVYRPAFVRPQPVALRPCLPAAA